MIRNGKFGGKFYKIEGQKIVFKTRQEYEESENKKLEEPKTLRKLAKLEDLENYYEYSALREQGNAF